MNYIRAMLLACCLLVSQAGSVSAEGFAMTEWSARGLSLAGGLVGRADDPSAIAYNPAGITQLSGTRFLVGSSAVMPYGEIYLRYKNGNNSVTDVNRDVWFPPHGYFTHQLNDNVWLGIGFFSRFGLGNGYTGDFAGASNIYDVGLKTISAVPVLAYKVNEHLSLAAGIEVMNVHLYEGVKVPTMFTPDPRRMFYNDMQVEGSGWGWGAHFGAHLRFNDQWSLGLTYKSQVTQNVSGEAVFGSQGRNLVAGVPNTVNTDVNGTVQLPDSISLGIAYKPLDNLSFEIGTIFYRWSTFNSLNIYFDSGYDAIGPKEWSDSWSFNASVEYKPLDWLALRLGYWHDTSPINENYSDFMLPTNGRDVISVGAGFKWDNWTLDMAYAHIFIYPVSYDDTRTSGVKTALNGVTGGNSQNAHADMLSVSLGYTF